MITIPTDRQYAVYRAQMASLAEAGNLMDDPDAGRDMAGHERAEARMAAAEHGVQYFDELDADDWDPDYPF